MARLVWDDPAERYYETGISQVVLFLRNEDGTYETGVPWNGLTGISEKYSCGDALDVYASDYMYMSYYNNKLFDISIEAYTYPDEFEECIGYNAADPSLVYVGAQDKRHFGLCYKTLVKDDYKLHIVYDCVVKPMERDYSTQSDKVDPTIFSWDTIVYPAIMQDYEPIPIIVLDSRLGDLATVESYLYGSVNTDSQLPSISEIISYLT